MCSDELVWKDANPLLMHWSFFYYYYSLPIDVSIARLCCLCVEIDIFKKWVLCDENQKIIAAVPQADTRLPGQNYTFVKYLIILYKCIAC